MNLTRKLIADHLADGAMAPRAEIGLRIDQTLTQDATGTLVMLEFEQMGLPRVRTELSAQYVDHNLIQEDFKNPDDHRFLQSACEKYGISFSPAGNGVSHPVHMERFGVPGKTLLGSDSHTPAAGSLGMLAIGAGGIDVALAMAGEPYRTRMPEVWGIRLTGELPDWVSAKDVILEMLRRHDVDGGKGRVLEYYGPGLKNLSAMDRHVIANMGTELGATSTVFPSDEVTKAFLEQQGRPEAWQPLHADEGAEYDLHEEIDLAKLVPLMAKPSSPGKVVPVSEEAGKEIFQAYIGSSANPGFRDFAVAAEIVRGRQVKPGVSFDVNPTSRQILENLTRHGYLGPLIHSGARLHQAGCNGCIGMGQAPATNEISLRTVPRNFPGRSGTREDKVYLCSPETAAASALTGEITDPRDLDRPFPRGLEPEDIELNESMIVPPLPASEAAGVELVKGPNVSVMPELDPVEDDLSAPVALKAADDISTDEILPAGAEVLPLRSNIPEISKYAFSGVEEGFYRRVQAEAPNGFFVVGGKNYGQGSSREHAALAPRFLGLRAVVAKGFARIHRQNLVNFGALPLVFDDPADYDRIEQGDELVIEGLAEHLESDGLTVRNRTRDQRYSVTHDLSERQCEILRKGGIVNWMRGGPKAPA